MFTDTSPAEVASLRTLMGLSQDRLADLLGRNRRVVRAWESGEYRIGPESVERLKALRDEHDKLVARMINPESTVVIPRRPHDPYPRGWYLAAAGRAMAAAPYLIVEWDDALDDSED